MQNRLKEIQDSAIAAIAAAGDEHSLFQLKSKYLGKKSEISDVLKSIAALSVDEKRSIGGLANTIKTELERVIDERADALLNSTGGVALNTALPGIKPLTGHLHPLTLTMRELKSVFIRMGFCIEEGPEVETDYYNFEALNTPPHHPARDMQDTFYLSPEILLRTHTSPVQVRVMKSQKPPIRAIMPGRVYRNEEVSARSYCLFHQIEGLYVDKGVSFADLKGTLDSFVKGYFGSSVKTKFRPSFFPFTEPSAEVDVQCFLCNAKGCPICKHTGWLEILGCGMVHPNVLRNGGIDPEEFSGFAFGMGVERIALLKYGIDDIRLFYENDLRVVSQF
ncbi:MAG: phenylalanine--tRNA ligase subunit alpha [Fibrobacteres bacterium]|nr:phenylalanine--tRNA ligase subunit alpha [Fibrobacterota bacterium]